MTGELEARVAEWVNTRIGPEHMHPRERAMRLLEEAVELAQAEGIAYDQVDRQVAHVYSRPAGEPAQEAAGVAVCLLGWCAATGNRLNDLALAEIERIEAKPIEQIRGSLARKADADLVTAVPVSSPSDTALLDWLEKHGAENVRGTDYPQWRIEGNYDQTLRDAIRDAIRDWVTA